MSGIGLVEGEGDGEAVRGVEQVAGSVGDRGSLGEGNDGWKLSIEVAEPWANSAPGAGVGEVLGKADEMGEELEGDVGAEMAAL